MLVKVKDPSRVYYDREQGATLTGKEVIQVKATYTVRQLLTDGALQEVVEEPKKEVEPKKPGVKLKDK